MERDEAIKKALSMRPDFKVERVTELDKCFVVTVIPNNYNKDSGIYIGSGIRVDKQTGETRLYNPLVEHLR